MMWLVWICLRIVYHYTPTPPKVEWGYTGFTRCLSVRLSIDKVSGTFLNNCWLNLFHTWHLPLWGESLDLYTFSCSKPHFRPSGGQIVGWKWGFWNFLKKLLAQLISYLAFTINRWVSLPLYIFVFLASFSALWWPNIWPKMGFPDLFFFKLLAQFISCLAFTLMGWVSWPYTFSCS